jgi:hypothetical protein
MLFNSPTRRYRSYTLAAACATTLLSAQAFAQTASISATSAPEVTVVALHASPLASIDLRLPTAPADERREDAQRLFRRRRIGGLLWTIIGGSTFIRTLATGVTSPDDQVGGAIVGAFIGGGIPIGIGLGKLSRFSRERENQALGAYDNAGTFPHYVEKRLD